MSKLICEVCPHHCHLDQHQIGKCKARMNKNDHIIPINYGRITSIALDPIEKKPLRHFYPEKKVLSVGSFGCNLKCSFCQNHEISMSSANKSNATFLAPEDLVSMAIDMIPKGNIGIAYTYNEPLVGVEYVRDCAKLARQNNLKNIVVTNGCFTQETLEQIVPFVDAMNIDLKGFKDLFYNNIDGDFACVKNFITQAAKSCHIEITTLIIPEENDTEEEIHDLSSFIASINPEIPLHLSRFFPCYKMNNKQATDVNHILNLATIARRNVHHVYVGNI